MDPIDKGLLHSQTPQLLRQKIAGYGTAPVGVLKKRCSHNMQQIYKRTSIPNWNLTKLQSNFIEIAL